MLRPYQNEMKSKIYEHWDAGVKNVMLQLPTGGGKTRVFCTVAIEKAINAGHNNMPTAIFVHRKELVQQISLTLSEQNIEHNIIAPRNVVLGIIAAQRQLMKRQYYNTNALVTVISVDTWISRVEKHYLKLASSIKLWITDEAAHLLKANKWGKAVSYCTNAIGLGVTATPERLDKRGLGSHVDGVFDVMVQGPSVRWLIENKFLSKYKVVIPKSDYENHLRAATGDSDYSKEAMAEASANSHIVGDVVENYQKFLNGKQAIVFASDIGAAFRMEKKFQEAGIKAKTLTGETLDSERLQALIDFRNKDLQVLINVDLFDEGLDVPGIEGVILARPTMSLGKYLQMCGRGLRPMEFKEFCIIIDHVGNVKKHGLPDNRRKWSLDRVTRRKKKVNLVRICPNTECNAPFDRLLLECPYCGYKDPAKKPGIGGGRVGPSQVDGDLVLVDPDTLRELEARTALEDPISVANRVSNVAGGPAGVKAMHNQIERIKVQKELADVIAQYAGKLRGEGFTDRQINKVFYQNYDKTIWEVLGETKAEMLDMIQELQNEL